MPPRVKLSSREAERLPSLLAQVEANRGEFPAGAEPPAQAGWIWRRYGLGDPLSLNLLTLLLFEHGVHRSVDQVAMDVAILMDDA